MRVKNRICKKCGATIENRNPHYPQWCRKCFNEYARYYNKKYYRTRILTTNIQGKKVCLRGNKRPYPKNGKCEICKTFYKHLAYHHWDIKNLLKGLWTCNMCNQMCDKVDKFLHIVYLKLKEITNKKAV